MKARTAAGLLCLGLWPSGRAVAAPPPPAHQFVLRFDGGNAYVFSEKDRRVDVGPILRPDTSTAAFKPHPMFLDVESGAVGQERDWPMPPASGGEHRWALAGYEIWACPDGVCAKKSSLGTSDNHGPDTTDPCHPATHKIAELDDPVVDNLYYLPDILELHGLRHLPQDWRTHVAGRVVLNTGKLVVAKTFNCVQLEGGNVKRRHAVVNGYSGMHYIVPFTSYIDLYFKAWPSRKIVGVVRLSPAPGEAEVEAHLGMPPAPPGTLLKTLTKDDDLPDFQQFYELVPKVKESDRLRAKYRPQDPVYTSPGEDCGSARYGGKRWKHQ